MTRQITSCLTCRRRKVRCDRRTPICSVCQRGNHACTYQSPSLTRIVPTTISGGMVAWGQENASILHRGPSETKHGSSGSVTSTPASCTSPAAAGMNTLPDKAKTTHHRGTLIMENECSRFVPPSHWASAAEPTRATDVATVRAQSLTTNMDEATRDVLMNPERVAQWPKNGRRSCAIPDRPLPYNTQSSRPSLIYALMGSRLDEEDKDITSQYYPQSATECRFLLDVFTSNVEAVISLFHKPTLRRAFDAHLAQQQLYEPATVALGSDSDRESHFEPLLFSIFFSAIYSMEATQVDAMFGASKTDMLKRFESALVLALDKESFISSPAIAVLQAFVLFLTCRCRDDEMQQIWAPVGLAVRMAQSLGLHKEPTEFSPGTMDAVQVEIRRRLWYQIFYLDVRTAVSQGLPPIITTASFTTRLPSNADDNDIMPGQPPLPNHYDPRKFTAMTIQLVRLHGVTSMQKLLHELPRDTLASEPERGPSRATDGLLAAAEEQDMRLLIETTLEKNHMLYLRHCDSRFPLHRLILDLSNHIKWKFWIYYYYKFPKGQRHSLAPAQKSLIFSQSLNLLESYIHMKNDPGLNPYRWMIDGHSGFHAASYVISVLEDTQSIADLDLELLERGKQMLQAICDFSANTESKAGSLLHHKVKNLMARTPAEVEAAGESEMNAAFFNDMNISNIDDWVNYLNDTM